MWNSLCSSGTFDSIEIFSYPDTAKVVLELACWKPAQLTYKNGKPMHSEFGHPSCTKCRICFYSVLSGRETMYKVGTMGEEIKVLPSMSMYNDTFSETQCMHVTAPGPSCLWKMEWAIYTIHPQKRPSWGNLCTVEHRRDRKSFRPPRETCSRTWSPHSRW